MSGKITTKARIIALVLMSAMLLGGCSVSINPSSQNQANTSSAGSENGTVKNDTGSAPAETGNSGADTNDTGTNDKQNIYIIFTSDVHCGVNDGFGYAGLKRIRDTLEENGFATILVDDGDHVQGDAIGTLTKGEDIIPIMNALKYDIAIPGNHDFDYGVEQFLKYPQLADFPYISCNFNKDGKLLFDPYIIKEVAGVKIGFVGVTTPQTLIEDSPGSFKDASGNYVYGFMEGDNGNKLYKAVQDAVDSVRAQGVDYVYLIGHLGNDKAAAPYNYIDVISNTTGIDVLLDGHSHDMDQVVMKNKEGKDVVRSACGYKLNAIGYSHIKAEDGTIDTNIWKWESKDSIPDLLGIKNEISDLIDAKMAELDVQLKKDVAKTDHDLVIYDPENKTDDGDPIRIVRTQETNLGDLCADAARIRTGADIGFINGGGVRDQIQKGDITYGDIIAVQPFNNKTVVIEVTGQQIADALEWGVSSLPDENGGFLQVSGMTFSVDAKVKSGCVADVDGFLKEIKGERRVSDIKVGGKPIDVSAKYTVAGNSFLLTEKGNGYTCFDGAKIVQEDAGMDNQLLIDYIVESLDGTVGDDYSDPYGQGRIVIKE